MSGALPMLSILLPPALLLLGCGLVVPGCVGKQAGLDSSPDSVASTDTDTNSQDTATATDTATTTDPGTAAPPPMVLLPAGTFTMGCTASQGTCHGKSTPHSVTLTHDYFVGVTEVTQAQFYAAMGYNPSLATAWETYPEGTDRPVETVTWYEAAAYANVLSRAAGLAECYTCGGAEAEVVCDVAINPYDCDGYRLLTEAEWEGAARCGTDLTYAGSDNVDDVAWTNHNGAYSSRFVASLAANGCGTYDMSGNVEEWTQDWWDGRSDYPPGDATDPVGEASDSGRVVRGGNFGSGESRARVSYRRWSTTDILGAVEWCGFRVGRSIP